MHPSPLQSPPQHSHRLMKLKYRLCGRICSSCDMMRQVLKCAVTPPPAACSSVRLGGCQAPHGLLLSAHAWRSTCHRCNRDKHVTPWTALRRGWAQCSQHAKQKPRILHCQSKTCVKVQDAKSSLEAAKVCSLCTSIPREQRSSVLLPEVREAANPVKLPRTSALGTI